MLLAPAQNAGPVQCAGSCKPEWERVQLWLTKHSQWKIQTVTDVVVQTFNPPTHDPSYGFSVTKEPSADGYQIALSAACANLYGCSPSLRDVRRAFYHYVTTGQDLLAGSPQYGGIR